MRNWLGKLAIRAHTSTPDFKGKQRLARNIQEHLLGETIQTTPEGMLIQARITSSMDLSYLQEGGHSVIRNEIKQLKAGQTFLDIGANIGYFSLLASKEVGNRGTVISVEPSNREFKVLIKNIDLNKASNITAINCAAADSLRIEQINIEPEHTGLNRIYSTTSTITAQPTLAARIESLIPPKALPIHLAKIDTEGYEMYSLLGMEKLLSRGQIKKIIVEISPEFLAQHGHDWKDIYKFLRQHKLIPANNTDKNNKQWDEVFTLSQLPKN